MPSKGKAHKTFAASQAFAYPTGEKRATFGELQRTLYYDSVLAMFDQSRQLLIDFDISKQRSIKAMAYHVDVVGPITSYPARTKVQPILFISRLLRQAEMKYWPTELEICTLV
jgi:hypothetical protein